MIALSGQGKVSDLSMLIDAIDSRESGGTYDAAWQGSTVRSVASLCQFVFSLNRDIDLTMAGGLHKTGLTGIFSNLILPVALIGTWTMLVLVVTLTGSNARRRRQLWQANRKLTNILDATNDAIITQSLDGKIKSWNKAAERLYGYQANEVIGTRFTLSIPSDREDPIEMILKSITSGEALDCLYTKCRTKAGALVGLILAGIPEYDEGGNMSGIFVMGKRTDSFESAEGVQVAQGIETRLRALVDYSAAAMALLSEEGKTLYCSAATVHILGCRPHEMLGCSVFDFIHREDQTTVRQALKEAIADPGRHVRVRTRVLHESGSWRWVEAVLKNLLHVRALQAIHVDFRDITDAVVAEEEARKSDQRFARAFRSSPVAISISTRSEGRYIDVNDAFLTMFGFRREQVIGRTSSMLNLWVEPQDRHVAIEEQGEGGYSRKPIQTRLRTSRGDIREVNLYLEMIEMDGSPSILAITHDVTGARRLENQFLRAQRMEAVGRLAGGMAHDFNNILAVILGHSEISQERLGRDHPVSRNIVQIKNAVERATTLIRQLLAFSRQQLLYPRVLDLNVLVKNLSELFLPMLGKEIALDLKLAVSVDSIRADLGQLEQVVMNLVVNACDAMRASGTLTVETANVELDASYASIHYPVVAGPYVMLAVSDTGCGIGEEALPHVFEPFFTTKGPGRGTGLGLATVYGIVKQSNGYIWVNSELGKGASFKMYFPKVEQPPQQIPKIQPERVPPAASGTILVVEDDYALRSVAVRLLDVPGYKVLESENAEAAIELAARYPGQIDLLLTGVTMPSINGGELAARIRESRPQMKVLFMSGYSSELVTQRGALEPGTLVIDKPFTRNALLTKVGLALQ